MTTKLKIATLATLAALGAVLSAVPAQAISNGWVTHRVKCLSGNVFEWIGPPNMGGGPELCPDGIDPAGTNTSPVGTRTFTLTSAVNLPALAADMVDLNNLNGDRAIETLGVDRAAIAAIREAQTRGAFTSAEDFALRVCTKTSVTLRGSAMRIGTIEYRSAPQRDPRRSAVVRLAPVFSCAAGSGAYEVAGRAHNYVGHVTLLR
jgi:hypothetical protein